MSTRRLAVIFAIGCLACFGSSRPRGTGESATVSIGNFGGSVFVEGASLFVPLGALDTDVSITLTSTTEAAPSGFDNYSPIFTIEPAGTVFKVPAELTLDLSGEQLSVAMFLSTSSGFEKVEASFSGDSATGKLLRAGKVFAADDSGGGGGGAGGGSGGGGGQHSFAPVQSIAAGIRDSCAVHTDGTVSCWGQNTMGSEDLSQGGVYPLPQPVLGLSGVTQLRGNASFYCAVSGGAVRCWGTNADGQLGDGTRIDRRSVVTVPGLSGATAVDNGLDSSCALLSDKTVRCWGSNRWGQCGDGTSTTPRLSPVSVTALSGVNQVEVGGAHACAVLSDKTVRCWGNNQHGQLGNGTSSLSVTSTPVQVSGLAGVEQLALGNYSSCARLTDGTVKCWGLGNGGELGDGATNLASLYAKSTPVAVVNLSGAVELAGNVYHYCARTSDGSVRCWGSNDRGELGDGTTDTFKNFPVAVTGLSGVLQVAVGFDHSCARTSSGVSCWGYNGFGSLGNGTSGTDSATPVGVKF